MNPRARSTVIIPQIPDPFSGFRLTSADHTSVVAPAVIEAIKLIGVGGTLIVIGIVLLNGSRLSPPPR